jgi:hypothetical protein
VEVDVVWAQSHAGRRVRIGLSLGLAAALAAAGLAAAEDLGELAGSVTDAANGPLPGVVIEAVCAPGPLRSVTTDHDGRYSLASVPAGRCEVAFRLPGFAASRQRVDVHAGETARADATLRLAFTAQVVVSGRSTFSDLASVSSREELVGVADAASVGVVPASQLEDRSIQRPGDLLERVPGVVISQHSGEGKANQYYVRGFNIDHGTDLSLTVAGVPVNLPTHAHGQGYADANFLIPELVSGVQYKKGPYFAEEGDFSAAGAVNVNYVNSLERPLAKLEAGEEGYGRALVAMSPSLLGGRLLYAFELEHNDGPWEHPDDFRKLNAVVRYSRGSARNGWSLSGMAYDARWSSSDQVAARAVSDGRIGRFGAIDPSDGGRTHRYTGAFEWQRSDARALSRLEAYVVDYTLNLFSNFTYFLDDPENGDQFEQADRRWVAGLRASQEWFSRWGGRELENAVGLQLRRDAIGTLGLYHTAARRRLGTVRQDEVDQASGAVYVQSRIRWSPVLRLQLGLRGDLYGFDVSSDTPLNSGKSTAALLSPKLGVALGPWGRTEVYLNAGYGFHSNDGRGATIRVDPQSGDPAPRVAPLVRAKGAELGVRTLALPNAHLTLALWGLDLDSELVFVGDAGTTEPGRPSRRLGLECLAEYAPRPWLSLDASVGYSRARFRDRDPAGDRIPGAVEGVWAAGASVDTRRWLGSLRLRYFGPRPLVESDGVRSRASTLVSGQLGYKLARGWRLKLDVFNLFDSQSSDVDYDYVSRLRGEPAEGIEDVHTHPVAPRTIRVGVTATF